MREVVAGCNDFGVARAEVSVLGRRDLVAGKAVRGKVHAAAVAAVSTLAGPQNNILDPSYRSRLFLCVREHLLRCACVK